MIRVGIILGSTRPNRLGAAVAGWVHELAAKRPDAAFDLIDVAEYNLPLLDEHLPAALVRYSREHTKRWAAKIASFDAFVFVAAEYNHGIPGALKNAIDFLYAEWNNKAAGFVSYGGAGGVRSVEQLRLVMGNLMVADVTAQVSLSLFTDFENFSVFKPDARHEGELTTLLDQVIGWGRALKTLRAASGG